MFMKNLRRYSPSVVAPPGYEVPRLTFQYPPREAGEGTSSVHPRAVAAKQVSTYTEQADQAIEIAD
jgi:hypothetical protein